MTELMALGIQQPQINTVGNFMQAQNAAIGQKSAIMQQEQAAHQAIAEHALGVMGGKLDGTVDPAALKQWTDELSASNDPHSKALAAQLVANPNLVPVMAKGSLAVLQAGQDQAKIDLAQKQYELDLQNAAAAARKGQFVEMTPGGTLHDTTGAQPDFTAPAKPPDNSFRMMTPEEIKTAGLPEGNAYQIDTVDGKITPISGQSGGITITNPDGTTTQIGGPAAKGVQAYDVADAKRLVDLGGQIADGGRSATSQIATLNQMEKLLGNDKVYTGIGADQVKQLQRFATTLGADPSGIQDTESFNAMAKKSVLDLAGGSLGTGFSNGDRDYLDAQVPSLDNTKAGNLELIGIMKKVADHKKDMAAFTADYKKQHDGRLDANFDGSLADWAEAHPVFADATAAGDAGSGKGGPVTIKDDADYAKLPSGTDFIGPDGHVRTKP